MSDLPEYGTEVLIRPLPGKKLVEQGHQNPTNQPHLWVPAHGVVRPWSAHWAFYLRDGAIDLSRPLPEEGDDVLVRHVKDRQVPRELPLPEEGPAQCSAQLLEMCRERYLDLVPAPEQPSGGVS